MSASARVFSAVLVSLLLLMVLTASHAKQREPKNYAILIGINAYPEGGGFSPLEGARNDVELVKNVLISHFAFNPDPKFMKVLVDENATHSSIQAAFEQVTAQAKAGDVVYIHYSGHGSQVADVSGDEKDRAGLDSTWVSYGSRTSLMDEAADGGGQKSAKRGGGNSPVSGAGATSDLDDYDVLDDELGNWLIKLSKKTDRIIFVSDSCHSGTITRGKEGPEDEGADTGRHTSTPHGKTSQGTGEVQGSPRFGLPRRPTRPRVPHSRWADLRLLHLVLGAVFEQHASRADLG